MMRHNIGVVPCNSPLLVYKRPSETGLGVLVHVLVGLHVDAWIWSKA